MGAEENSRLVRGFHLAGLGGEAGFAVRRGICVLLSLPGEVVAPLYAKRC